MNCMRENETSSERASALASIVFPTPGKVLEDQMALADQAEDTEAQCLVGRMDDPAQGCRRSRGSSRPRPSLSTRWLPGSLTQQFLGGIYDRRRDLVFRRLRHAGAPRRR